MALTVTFVDLGVFGNKRIAHANLAFDSSYAYGGEEFTSTVKTQLGLANIDYVLAEPTKGVNFEYDYSNNKLKAYLAAPAIVYDEKQTAVNNLVTLDYPAAFIVNVAKAGVNQAMRSVGASLGGDECALTALMEYGVRTRITTHGATDTIFVTYITQAWLDVWTNLVQEEVITLATGANNIANAMLAFMYADQITAPVTKLVPIDQDDAVATGEIDLLLGNATGALTVHADQNAKTIKLTYLKKPSGGFLADRAFTNATMLESGTGVNTLPLYPLLLWGYAGYAPIFEATTSTLINMVDTPGAGEANFTKTTSVLQFGNDNAAGTAAGVWGFPHEIPGLVPLEVRNGTDLSGLTGVRVLVFGG